MKLKNEALQKLYDRLVDGPISLSVYAGVLEKPFEEVDRELANLQNRNDILEKSNGTLLDANRDLKKELDAAKSSVEYFKDSREKWRSRAKHEEEEKIEQVKHADILKSQRDEEVDEKFQLQREVEQLKKQLDDLRHRAQCTEDDFKKANADRGYYMDIYKKVQDDCDELHRKYSECQGTVDKQAEQIRNLKARLNGCCGVDYDKYIQRIQDGVREIGYDQGQTDLWDMLQNVNDTQPNEFDVECESMEDVIGMDLEDFLNCYKKWQEQKETDRMREWLVDFCWGRVCEGCPLESKEYKCGCGYSFRKTDPSDLGIIPDKDIKRYYEKARGCGRYTLKDAKLFATTVEGVNRAITKACEGFCEAVRDADTKITENLRKGCTFEAEVEINKDLLEKVCGVKPEEEKSKPGELVITTRGVTTANYSESTMNAIKEAVRRFEKSLPALDSWESTIEGSIKVDDILGKANNTEHKFEYGDAVRVPWRDYDYMYIGPEAKHIRLFNPKSHTVIFVSPSEKLKYQGCKIVICDEEDLRKIWKYKK